MPSRLNIALFLALTGEFIYVPILEVINCSVIICCQCSKIEDESGMSW